MLTAQDKQIVEDRLYSYDSLLDSDPEIQERIAKAKVEAQQKAVIELVEIRFPTLIEAAQEQVARLNKPDD